MQSLVERCTQFCRKPQRRTADAQPARRLVRATQGVRVPVRGKRSKREVGLIARRSEITQSPVRVCRDT